MNVFSAKYCCQTFNVLSCIYLEENELGDSHLSGVTPNRQSLELET